MNNSHKPYVDDLNNIALPLLPTSDLVPIRTKLVHMLPHLTSVVDRIQDQYAFSLHHQLRLQLYKIAHLMVHFYFEKTHFDYTKVAASQFIKIPPILLVGPPGNGKTPLLEELVKALNIPSLTVDAAGRSDANFLGVDRSWAAGSAGVHLDLIHTHKVANPVVIIDELEKAGGSERNGDPRAILLGLIEPQRAGSYVIL